MHLLLYPSLICPFLHQIKVNRFLPFNDNDYYNNKKKQYYSDDKVYEEVLLLDVIVIMLAVVDKCEFVTCFVWDCQYVVFVTFR